MTTHTTTSISINCYCLLLTSQKSKVDFSCDLKSENSNVTKQPFHIFCLKTVLKFSTVKNKVEICRKTRPDTAKLLAFLKSAAKNTPSTIYSFMTSKISQTSVMFEKQLPFFSCVVNLAYNFNGKTLIYFMKETFLSVLL